MTRTAFLARCSALLILLSGCADDTVARPALIIDVVDAATGAPEAYDATLIVRSGSYADTIVGSDFIYIDHRDQVSTLMAADNRTGRFDVTILHPDFQTWQRNGISVTRADDSSPFDGSPLPETVFLVAELQPKPES